MPGKPRLQERAIRGPASRGQPQARASRPAAGQSAPAAKSRTFSATSKRWRLQTGSGSRPADLCHGRHHEPPADLGHGAGAAGRHVQRREDRWAGSTCSSSTSAAPASAGPPSGSAIPTRLPRLMTTVECHGGYTQIRKVLSHARQESEKRKVNALVYVGDCMEEDADDLCGRAGELALLGVPMFLFQEGQ